MNTLGLEMFFFFLEILDSITSVCSELIALSLVSDLMIILEIGGGLLFSVFFSKRSHLSLTCHCR